MSSQLEAGMEIGHPLRLRIMLACAQQPQSPKTMETRQEPLGTIAYHFRILRERGLLAEHSRVRRRGSVQTYYVLSDAGRALLDG